MLRLLIFLSVALAGCAGCDERDPTGLSGAVRIDGSSTVFPLSEAVAEEFMRDHPGVRVTVGASGTGGGFAKFARGETDVSDASRAIEAGEVDDLASAGIGFIELPVAYDGIAVVVHPATDWVDCLTTDELAAIWEPGSDAETWADVRSSFPDVPLRLYGPGLKQLSFNASHGASNPSGAFDAEKHGPEKAIDGIIAGPADEQWDSAAWLEARAEKAPRCGRDVAAWLWMRAANEEL